ncbi:MAG TPA: peptide chain release factor 1 [Candidatus Dependentiae bacterium]|nr:peptide chain release factor 1 [Candidatus Dependentiae bacterium]
MASEIAWQEIQEQHDALGVKLADPTLDRAKRRTLQKELARLATLLSRHNLIESLERSIQETMSQSQANTDPELAELYQEEINELKQQRDTAVNSLEDLMFPSDPLDDRSVYLEIRAGTGGQEAALFAGDLLRMYSNYALKRGWRVSVEDSSPTDLGGYKEVVVHVSGAGVYGDLKHESGVHRVQRVPATEGAGRIHTSTATVVVLPEADDIDVTINPSDLRIDTYRSGGAGGQHVNRTDSAVRITHIPTGVVVACQDERSQHKNREKAMKVLQSRLLAAQIEQQNQAVSEKRREQVGTGERAEKVRTYNFPQNRITDHQVNLTLKNLDVVIDGELDPIIDALREKERADRRKNPLIIQ